MAALNYVHIYMCQCQAVKGESIWPFRSTISLHVTDALFIINLIQQ